MEELKNLCVKIPLLNSITEISIYNKFIKETFMKGPSRKKKKDPTTINVVGHLSNIMLGKILNPKYAKLGSVVVIVNIKSVFIPNTLIDLWETINVISKDRMLKLNLQASLRYTTIVLQLVDSSIVCPEGILEDIIVWVES